MAKNKGLYINENDLKNAIKEFCEDDSCIKNEEVKNEANHQTRIHLEKDGQAFYIDVFYNKANTITVSPHNGDSLSNQLCEYIKEGVQYKDVPKGQFTCEIDEEKFNLLVEYLEQLDGVKVAERVQRGNNGYQVRFISDIGDSISLTFYKTQSKMSFQGCLIKLYTEVKCFIGAFTRIPNKIINLIQNSKEQQISNLLEKQLPNSSVVIDAMQKDLLYDSIAQIVCEPITKDYSIWTFSALKSLEARIKHIFNNNGITIHDEKGFSIKRSNSKIPMFNFNKTNGSYSVNTGIISITDVNTLAELGKLYTYFKQNRDSLFHTKQAGATRILTTAALAEDIIYKTCALIDNSYKVLGK